MFPRSQVSYLEERSMVTWHWTPNRNQNSHRGDSRKLLKYIKCFFDFVLRWIWFACREEANTQLLGFVLLWLFLGYLSPVEILTLGQKVSAVSAAEIIFTLSLCEWANWIICQGCPVKACLLVCGTQTGPGCDPSDFLCSDGTLPLDYGPTD